MTSTHESSSTPSLVSSEATASPEEDSQSDKTEKDVAGNDFKGEKEAGVSALLMAAYAMTELHGNSNQADNGGDEKKETDLLLSPSRVTKKHNPINASNEFRSPKRKASEPMVICTPVGQLSSAIAPPRWLLPSAGALSTTEGPPTIDQKMDTPKTTDDSSNDKDRKLKRSRLGTVEKRLIVADTSGPVFGKGISEMTPSSTTGTFGPNTNKAGLFRERQASLGSDDDDDNNNDDSDGGGNDTKNTGRSGTPDGEAALVQRSEPFRSDFITPKQQRRARYGDGVVTPVTARCIDFQQMEVTDKSPERA